MAELVGDEAGLVAAAVGGDQEAFRRLVEPLRRELHLFSYRMLGSFQDAEDVLQDAQLKAWRRLQSYDRRASFRTWMYKIVSNTTLDALRSRRRRILPQDLGPPREAAQGLGDQRLDVPWLEPYPGTLFQADPEAAVELRESVRFAFVRMLQVLPPRQRAVLILREVLDWSAAEVAAMLGISVPAVNSALQRARVTVEERGESAAGKHAARVDQKTDQMAARYISAWEAGDIEAVVAMLTSDATHAMPPWPAWFVGRDALRTLYTDYEVWNGHPGPGVFRVLQIPMNADLGFAEYCREGRTGPYKALALTLAIVNRDGTRMVEKVSFVNPELFSKFGLRETLEGTDGI